MKLKILFIDINSYNNKIIEKENDNEIENENKNEKKSLSNELINIFINEHIVVGKKINNDIDNPEKNFISFTYQVKAGNTAQIFFYQLKKLKKNYAINLKIDAFLILVDIENENSLLELDKVLTFIKENYSKDIENYILGIYENKNNIIEDFKENKIKKFLNKKKININYQNILFLIENNEHKQLNVILEDLLNKIFEIKKNKKSKNQKKIENEEEHFDFDDDQSRSKCLIF